MIEMTRYVVATGEIKGWLQVDSDAEVLGNAAMLPSEEALIDGEWDENTHYILEETVALRPVFVFPTTHALTVGVDWPVPGIPEGTVVEIDGEVVGTVDATGLELNFAAAGVWPVTLRPPFPWIEASCEVVVS